MRGHSPGLSSDGEVDLTEGSMIEPALEHLELTAGLAARAMIEPTAVLDGGSMTGPDLTSVSANISMIEPVLEALDLTTVTAESSIIEYALEAASLFTVYLKWLPDPCPKFVACKTCQVGLNALKAQLWSMRHCHQMRFLPF